MKINNQDEWFAISEVGLPTKGSYYDCYTFDKNGRIVEKLYLEYNPFAVDWAYQKGGPVWQYDVTHWREVSISADVPQPQEPITHSIFVDDDNYAYIVEFNEYCAKVRGIKTYQDQYCDLDYAVRNAATFTAYRAWNEVDEMEKVMKVLLEPSDLKSLELSIEMNGKESVYRTCIHNLMNGVGPHMNFEDKDVDGLSLEEAYDTVTDYKHEFNEQCYEILVNHGKNVAFAVAWSPYDNLSQLSIIMDIVLEKSGGTFVCNGETDLTFTEEQRQYIRKYGTDKYLRSEEYKFNRLCGEILNGKGKGVDCDQNVFFDAYNNMQQLALVMPVVIRWSEQPFAIPGVMENLGNPECYDYDIQTNMRVYVQRFGQDVLDMMHA